MSPLALPEELASLDESTSLAVQDLTETTPFLSLESTEDLPARSPSKIPLPIGSKSRKVSESSTGDEGPHESKREISAEIALLTKSPSKSRGAGPSKEQHPSQDARSSKGVNLDSSIASLAPSELTEEEALQIAIDNSIVDAKKAGIEVQKAVDVDQTALFWAADPSMMIHPSERMRGKRGEWRLYRPEVTFVYLGGNEFKTDYSCGYCRYIIHYPSYSESRQTRLNTVRKLIQQSEHEEWKSYWRNFDHFFKAFLPTRKHWNGNSNLSL